MSLELGIFTPYRRGEVTAAAVRLADFALLQSYKVKIMVDGPAERGVHPYWDTRITSVNGAGIYRWAQGCSHLIWFSPNRRWLEMTKVVADKAQHIQVISWHNLRPDQLKASWDGDLIVCPSQLVKERFLEVSANLGVPAKVKWCCWDSGLNPIQKAKDLVENDKVRDCASLAKCDSMPLAG